MHSLINKYRPITGSPFRSNEAYREIAPCDALKPFIRCFWGTEMPAAADKSESTDQLIIPDTCMDIIFHINYAENKYDGYFCTIDEHSVYIPAVKSAKSSATFAIRFYAWTAILFSEEAFTGCKNRAFSVEIFFERLKKELEPILFDVPSLTGKIAVTERLLLEKLRESRINSSLMNAVYYMLLTDCRAKISDVCSYTALSRRQLERIFDYNTGVSPKTLMSLLRYQLLWQDIAFTDNFKVLDAVEKYGYADQPHLLRDFKSRHLMTPREAVEFAAKDR